MEHSHYGTYSVHWFTGRHLPTITDGDDQVMVELIELHRGMSARRPTGLPDSPDGQGLGFR